MAQIDIVQRFLDAGADFSQLTQRNAERLVKSLVDAGDLQANQAQRAVKDLLDQGRRHRERLVKIVDREVQAQVARMGLATQADLARLDRKIETVTKSTGTTSTKKKTPAKKSSAAKKKSPGKKKSSSK
jgi:polyhydroxyalkanoate synthesis regulator phasin